MTTSTLVSGKAAEAVKLFLRQSRTYSSAAAAAATISRKAAKFEDQSSQRDLFFNVLHANATKRDAKQYLARFKPAPTKCSAVQDERNDRHRRDQDRLERAGVNLGGLYTPARAIANTPLFTRHKAEERAAVHPETLHVSLVLLREPEKLNDTTLDGVAMTLSQLVKLDMQVVVLLDSSAPTALHEGDGVPPEQSHDLSTTRQVLSEQAERLSRALASHSIAGARYVEGAFGLSDGALNGRLSLTNVAIPRLILEPLKRGSVAILPPLAYNGTSVLKRIPAPSAMLALTKELAGLDHQHNESAQEPAHSVDRIIVLDSQGGIPSRARGNTAHVFVNLEQEYDEIRAELSGNAGVSYSAGTEVSTKVKHWSNLDMTRQCLALLPSDASALIVTPEEAASSSQQPSDDVALSIGTRKQKNTLIHNLLTNKPLVSPSLPVARLPVTGPYSTNAQLPVVPSATLIKRGIPLTIIPAVSGGLGWSAPPNGFTSLALEEDPRVNFPRLLHLIEDSFRRKLDVKHYLSRTQGRIAGLIVAGEYEGGAILTWEPAPSAPNDPTRLVPYLDKFAVLQSSQGSSGVADIVFQALVRSCFPHGVCWRSRKDNPVNKWYFERSEGTWQIPGTSWTMFWTGEGVAEDEEKWNDYVGVCEGVNPSWADGTKPD